MLQNVSRREFLAGIAMATAPFVFTSDAAGALTHTSNADKPPTNFILPADDVWSPSYPTLGRIDLPGYTKLADLQSLNLDVQRTLDTGRLTVEGQGTYGDLGHHLGKFPQGAIIHMPAGLTLRGFRLKLTSASNMADGAVIRFQGPTTGKRPEIVGVTEGDHPDGGTIEVSNQYPKPRLRRALEIDNIDVTGQVVTWSIKHTIYAPYFSLQRYTNMNVQGKKKGNGLFMQSAFDTTLEMDSCHFTRGGWTGAHHSTYIGGIRSVDIRNCSFRSPWSEGHCYKEYSRNSFIAGCLFEMTHTMEDLAAGRYGTFPPVDVGAYAQRTFIHNTIRRAGGKRRNPAIDIRNRTHASTTPDNNLYGEPWVTPTPDYLDVDNRDLANPHLLIQLVAFNNFVNGVMPDGSPDPNVVAKPYFPIRNNGANKWLYKNSPPEFTSLDAAGRRTVPVWWQDRMEPCVVVMHANKHYGVPFRSPTSDGHAYVYRREPWYRTPTISLDILPANLRERLA